MKKILIALLVCSITLSHAQKMATDLVFNNDAKISWLGVDFSHVKLIGDFSHFAGFGERNSSQIKNNYFDSWNKLIINERDKYDIKGMLRKDEIIYDIDMVSSLNENTPLCNIEAYNNPKYTLEDVNGFIAGYDLQGKTGIGVVFIAESLNKAENEGYFHFVAIDMSTKQVLIHERLQGEPGGFGIRNFWAGSIHDVMEKIEEIYYRNWRSACAKR
jgi:hypothetical protein